MSARTPLLVGLVLVIAALSLSWFVMTTSKDVYSDDNTFHLFADFTDASGIRWKTRVQINGIDVGKIDSVAHEPDEYGQLMARVKIRILKDYTLYTNSIVRKTAESLLGDYRLDLVPGGPYDMCKRDFDCNDGFDCKDRRCIRACDSTPECRDGQSCYEGVCIYDKVKPGDILTDVQVPASIDEIQNSMNHVVENVDALTESFKKVLAGPEGEGSLKAILDRVEKSMEAIEAATSVLAGTISRNDETIDRVMGNLGQFSDRLAHSAGPQGDLTRLSENLANLSSRINNIARSVEDMVEGDEWAEGGSIRDTVDRLNDSIAHINDITRKIDEGQGTLGRVVNDPGIAEKVEQTLDDTSELIGSLSKLQTEIELRSEYAVPFGAENEIVQASMKNTVGLRVRPKPDKYYLLEAISDPRGVQTRKITTRTDIDNNTSSAVEEVVTDFGGLKFSAMFAKRYFFLTLRFGIIESTGGIGANLHALDDSLELRLDAFDFSRQDPLNPNRAVFPRLRSIAMWEFMDHLYLQGGFDDPLNKRLRTWFLGGALRFTDDDLKALLTVVPAP